MELKDAFKIDELGKELEKQGLPYLEQGAEKVLEAVLIWGRKGLVDMGGLYAAIGLPGLAMLEPMAKGAIDKIDGQPG